MKSKFECVERHFCWKVPSDKKKVQFKRTQYVKDDVMVGFIGYCEPASANEIRTVEVNMRSRVVVLPETGRQNGHLASEFFNNHSKEGDYVLDLACRSGAATLAAAALGRNSVSVDVEENSVGEALC
jgi:ribosomal protein L11 methylase PrmA